jgi:DNA-binding protein HU-beta
MNYSELKKAVSEKANLTQADAERALKALADIILTTVKQKERITYTGLGYFENSTRKPRMGFNPQTGEKIHIGETHGCKLKIGKSAKEFLNE